MMNRSVTWALVSLFIVAAVVVIGARSVGAQGTVITLADGVVVPGNGFLDLGPVPVDGFQQASFLGFASSEGTTSVLAFNFGFSVDPISFSDPGSQIGGGSGCSVYATTFPRGVACGSQQIVFPIAGPYLIVRVLGTNDAIDRSITLKAYLR